MLVESANPIHSLADAKRLRQAFEALDFVVVVDVAMTETAELPDYVLPASSQYEKFEATFFPSEFPDNFFHLRRPLMDALPGTSHTSCTAPWARPCLTAPPGPGPTGGRWGRVTTSRRLYAAV